ncbi:superoxide dismutase [Tieghemostelium lacteum]|uniref:Superoxide dismutase n=1 Tax=Tieghemostelium lacteum TaxID=361077 RepID=A0A151Z7M4_TIELA|nr:superoxide dismutase [Tieghemostelium lacteum]|eukprot:KYQ89784.1 superoxide dismutase [Tieghemostelium lacteum]
MKNSQTYIYFDPTNFGEAPNSTFALIAHNTGDTTKTLDFNTIFNPQNQSTCEKPGVIGNFGINSTLLQVDSTKLTLVGPNSLMGLLVAIYEFPYNCNETDAYLAAGNIISKCVIGYANSIGNVPGVLSGYITRGAPNGAIKEMGPVGIVHKAICNFIQNDAVAPEGSNITGSLYFETDASRVVTYVYGQIYGFNGSAHGLHIHTYGDISSTNSLGVHWKLPAKQEHSLPPQMVRDYGDLGNVQQYQNDIAYYKYCTNYFPSNDTVNYIGRSVGLKEYQDLGDKAAKSFGLTMASCVIGYLDPDTPRPFEVPSSITLPPDVTSCYPEPTPEPSQPQSSESSDSDGISTASHISSTNPIFIVLSFTTIILSFLFL